MKTMPYLRVYLFMCFSAVGAIHGKEQTIEKTLVGIWQDAPVISSGWGETYQFFENGRFQLNHNQVECDKRELSVSGTWEINGKLLVLTVTERRFIKGGKLVPATGSCGGDFEIEGGENVKKALKKPVKKQLFLSKPTYDKEFKLPVIKFNKQRFWKHREDPDDYE